MLGVRPNARAYRLMSGLDCQKLTRELKMPARQEGCSKVVEKKNSHALRRLINKIKLFQLANLVRTVEEGHGEVNSIYLYFSFNRTEKKKLRKVVKAKKKTGF